MSTSVRNIIRPIIRGAYDQQKLRIQTGNRIVANFKAKLGQPAGMTEEESLSDEAQDLLARLRQSYRLIGSAVAQFKKTKGEPKIFVGDELISTETELALVEQYLDLEDQERRTFRRVEIVLERIPIYVHYLKNVKGIGPAMGGVIVAEVDIHKARHVSNLWSYAGLDVAADGRGRSRRAEHLVPREYADKKGETQVRQSITFNPFLKTKLLGVLASSFLRVGNEQYRAIYDGYKHRLENHEIHKEKSKGWRHAMAMRYMVKMFLCDLYLTWRPMEGLTITQSYQDAKLGGHRDAA